MYKVLLESRIEKELRRLPNNIHEEIINRLKDLARTPRPHGCKKITGSKQDWRIRIGDYRVVYEIVDKIKEIRIMRIGHRSDIYKL